MSRLTDFQRLVPSGSLPPERPEAIPVRHWTVLVEHVGNMVPQKDVALGEGVSVTRIRSLLRYAVLRLPDIRERIDRCWEEDEDAFTRARDPEASRRTWVWSSLMAALDSS